MTATDNLGLLIAGLFRAVTTGTKSSTGKPFTDTLGVTHDMQFYGTNNQNVFAESGGGDTVQVGQGLTPATRQDIEIEQPFTNGGVEDNKIGSGAGGYNAGLAKVQIPTQISPTAGSGTITEICRFMNLRDSTLGTTQTYLFFRDLVPATGFIAGKTIDVSHEGSI